MAILKPMTSAVYITPIRKLPRVLLKRQLYLLRAYEKALKKK